MSDYLAQTVDIETPELVVVSYTIAGLGSRVYAALIDLAICAGLMIALLFGLFFLAGTLAGTVGRGERGSLVTPSTAWVAAILILMQFVILWGYYILFEGFRDGQTPGKKKFGLRAVRDGGYSVGFSASAVRNLMRILDGQPAFTYMVGIISIAVTKSGKRLGDIVAGTIVVRETLVRQPVTPPPRAESADAAPVAAQLTDAEFRLLERWSERRNSLEPERRRQLTTQVADRLRRALPTDGSSSEVARLVRLLERERQARDRGSAAHGTTGASRERYAIVTTSSPRWIAFASRLTEVQRRGLRALDEINVRDFVSEYRALSVDLARLRTAARGQASDELFYLGRLVAGAHNILYRDRRRSVGDVLRFLAVDVPTEVRRSVLPIAIAAAFTFVPSIIAYTAVVRDPRTAATFIPVGMLDRAEAGVSRARSGDGYIEDPQVLRPVMASSIVANNIQVTIAAFGLGITAGLGTLWLLLMNGVSLGGVFGLYQSYHVLPLLVAFVAPHGVLELTAICIAGGAGLLIGAAMILPGARTRRRALAENSRRAMHLMAASTLFLIVAGSLEGLVSPIPWWPVSLKIIVSIATLVLMIVYLRGGARAVRSPRAP